MKSRVNRGKDHCGVKSQSVIFAKPPATVRITGLVQVARCPIFWARGTSLFQGRRSMFNWIFQHGFLYSCLESVNAALELQCTRRSNSAVYMDTAVTTCVVCNSHWLPCSISLVGNHFVVRLVWGKALKIVWSTFVERKIVPRVDMKGVIYIFP